MPSIRQEINDCDNLLAGKALQSIQHLETNSAIMKHKYLALGVRFFCTRL